MSESPRREYGGGGKLVSSEPFRKDGEVLPLTTNRVPDVPVQGKGRQIVGPKPMSIYELVKQRKAAKKR